MPDVSQQIQEERVTTERLPDDLADALSLAAHQASLGFGPEHPVHVDLSAFGSTSMVDAWLDVDIREPGRLVSWFSLECPWNGYVGVRRRGGKRR